jgi:hypothetical protein
MKRLASFGVLLCFCILPPCFGSHPRHKTYASFEEMIKGEPDGVSITGNGKLIMAPAFEAQLDTEEAFVYSAVAGPDGTLYVGTGNNGKIFRLQRNGNGGEWSKLNEPGVYALAMDSMGRLYAGTSPEGKVYRFDSQGNPETLYDPGDKYIWDLVVDPQNNVYVATGPSGIIYKVDSSGNGTPFYDSEESHIVELEWDLDRNLLAGSSPEGRLFRIAPDGKAFVLYDSSLEEMKAIAVDRYGIIYAAALSDGQTLKNGDKKDASSNANKPEDESTVQVEGSSKGGKLEVYRISRENLVEMLFSSDSELVFDLLIRSDGNLLIATGNEGRLVALSPQRFATLLVKVPEEQITQLVETNGTVYTVTSNLGKVFKLEAQPSAKGSYQSEVLDSRVVSRWGVIRWTVENPSAAEGIRLYTRSGNTKIPDETWEDWKGPYRDPAGSQINSTFARFIQWKAEFGPEARPDQLLSQANALDSVTISYLQHNLAPVVTDLTVHSPGMAFVRPPASPPAGGIWPGGPDKSHARSLPQSVRQFAENKVTTPPRRVYIPGSRSFSWKAVDENEDSLLFTVSYRHQEQSEWRTLARNIDETEYTIDAASFPDGTYLVRVTATDEASNPASEALTDQLTSKPFVIANTAPVFELDTPQIQGRNATLRFRVQTQASPVYQVEYSIDAEEWKVVHSEDGITDSTLENFTITLENLTPGQHTLTLRAVDLVGNLSSIYTTLTVQ